MQKKQFCDARDGKKYVYVTIGEGEAAKTWMAENLNYGGDGSKGRCYDDDPDNCDMYGKLYDWSTAMDFDDLCNVYPIGHDRCKETLGSPHQGICPSGWHLPTRAEMDYLRTVAGSGLPYKKLMVKEGWLHWSGQSMSGEDTYGFAALPGGFSENGSSFSQILTLSALWTAFEIGNNSAGIFCFACEMSNIDKSYLFSVRCVQD
jgi:uncharacterized protein (TIGR02145 family)